MLLRVARLRTIDFCFFIDMLDVFVLMVLYECICF